MKQICLNVAREIETDSHESVLHSLELVYGGITGCHSCNAALFDLRSDVYVLYNLTSPVINATSC